MVQVGSFQPGKVIENEPTIPPAKQINHMMMFSGMPFFRKDKAVQMPFLWWFHSYKKLSYKVEVKFNQYIVIVNAMEILTEAWWKYNAEKVQ